MEMPHRHSDYDNLVDYVWEPLNPDVRSQVLAVKSSLTSTNKEEKMMGLNLYLMMQSTGIDQEHLKIMAKAGTAMFYVNNPRPDNLSHTQPILDPCIINKSLIEGRFFQCRLLESDNGEFDIGYELRCIDPNGEEYVAIVPDNSVRCIEKRIDLSERLATEREASDTERKLGACFKLLGEAKSEEFRDIVQDLADSFYCQDIDSGDYCRDIGMCATDLMNHPVIISNKDYLPALEYILRNSLDDDVPWRVEGLADDMVVRDNVVYPDNIRDVSLSHATYHGLTIESPEVEKKGSIYVSTGRMTPAYIFEHNVGGVIERVTVPLMHVKGIYFDNETTWRLRYDDYVRTNPKVGDSLAGLAMRRESERVKKYEPQSLTA
jgi:hypothetical protein